MFSLRNTILHAFAEARLGDLRPVLITMLKSGIRNRHLENDWKEFRGKLQDRLASSVCRPEQRGSGESCIKPWTGRTGFLDFFHER